MHFIFIVNDLPLRKEIIPGEKVVEYLLHEKVWLFTPLTPNLRKINKGDKVIIYLAGLKRRYFVCSFEVNSRIFEHGASVAEKVETDIGRIFKIAIKIKNIHIFQSPICLNEELRSKLIFIVDKKNWGLFFRQAIKVIDEQDYNSIVNSSEL